MVGKVNYHMAIWRLLTTTVIERVATISKYEISEISLRVHEQKNFRWKRSIGNIHISSWRCDNCSEYTTSVENTSPGQHFLWDRVMVSKRGVDTERNGWGVIPRWWRGRWNHRVGGVVYQERWKWWRGIWWEKEEILGGEPVRTRQNPICTRRRPMCTRQKPIRTPQMADPYVTKADLYETEADPYETKITRPRWL